MKERVETLDAIVARLRRAEPAIADGQFTATVMTQVTPYRHLPTWLANTLVVSATVLGSGIAAWQLRLPVAELLAQALAGPAPNLIGTVVALVYVLSGSILWLTRED